MTTKLMSLPGFASRLIDASVTDEAALEDLWALEPIALKVGRSLETINKLLSNKWEKPTEKPKFAPLVHIGQDLIWNSKSIGKEIAANPESAFELEDYFVMLNALFELCQNLIVENQESLHNKAVKTHMRNVANAILVETRALDVVNAIFDRFESTRQDEQEGPEEDGPQAS